MDPPSGDQAGCMIAASLAETISVAEGLVFESGRPVLLLPEVTVPELKFDRIAIAWDGSSVAARAMSDAMPLLRQASSVAIVQITGEKDLSKAAAPAEAVRNLKLHDIEAEVARLEALGAKRLSNIRGWVVMEAPTGQRFCVVKPARANFAETANSWR